MYDFLAHLFDTTGFPPRWYCGSWTDGHGWLHILSDLGIWSAYLAIPCVLGYFILRRKDIPFRTIFLLFVAFILACGTTHLMEALIFWWPAYRLAGVIKLITAIVSWATVFALVPVVPKVLSMRSPEELEREVAAREIAEVALQKANAELERRVAERTAELAQANDALILANRHKDELLAGLRESEEKFRLMADTIPQLAWMARPDGHIFWYNRRWYEFTGSTPEEMLGWGWRAVQDPERLPEVADRWNASLASGEPFDMVFPLRAANGKFHSFLTRVNPLRSADGRIVYWFGTNTDITELKEMEAALRSSEDRFRQLADSMPQIVWTARPDGIIDYYNRQWHEFTGFTATSGNEGWDAILHPDDLAWSKKQWNDSLRAGVPFEMQVRLLDRRTQSYRWHLIRTLPARNEAGEIVRWYGASTDITDQKRNEQTSHFLAEASAALAGLVDYGSTLQKVAGLSVPFFADSCVIQLTEAPGVLRRVAAARRNGGPAEAGDDSKSLAPADPPAKWGPWNIARTGQSEWIAEIEDDHRPLLEQFGSPFPSTHEPRVASYLGVPLKVRDRVLGVITFIAAESGRRYTAADLAVAEELANRATVAIENARLYREVTEADRRKDVFLATLAHELRNPLAPIRNSVYIMGKRGLGDPQLQWARDIIERQVNHLSRLVDDLLDISRISRGKIELRKQSVLLADIVHGAVETTRPLMEERKHELAVSLPAEPIHLDADPTRIEQAISNLLNNSAKYTEPGGHISIVAENHGTSIEIRVRDTGIGIEPKMLPTVFEMFVQGDHAKDRAQGGLGIGLSLVRSLVQMHGGSVSARSDGPGTGSEFVIGLPIAGQSRESATSSLSLSPLAAVRSLHRILVVDDNVDAAESLSMLLKLAGHHVVVAHDGKHALEAVGAKAFDLIFLDIGLPGMDGYEVARRIRQMPGGTDILLFALTGWGQEEDRRRSKQAGFDQHLVKPIDAATLQSLLGEMTNPAAGGRADAP